MKRRWNLFFSMLVGFCGGTFAAYLSPGILHAQQPVQRVVSAQRFVLLDSHGAQAGVLGFDQNGIPEITLIDAAGQVVWSTQTHPVR